jgi:DNA-binding CsgD family transcriptional regulator
VEALVNGSGRLDTSGLSKRELAVLRLLTDGASNAGIAGELGVSVNTVRTHVRGVLAKLGASSRREAVRIAGERRLLDDPARRLLAEVRPLLVDVPRCRRHDPAQPGWATGRRKAGARRFAGQASVLLGMGGRRG